MFKTFDDLKKDNKEQNSDRNNSSNGKTEKDFENQKDANGILKRAEENARKLLFKKEKPNADCIITLYKNGFIINDEPFRDYYDNANLKFMAELNKGLVPQELRRKYPKGLNMGIVDQKSEVFGKDPVPEPVIFTGQATSLGTIPPTNTTTVTTTNIAKPVVVDNENEELKVDHSKPKTRILIRLHNGKTQEIDVNLTTKLYEIFFYTWNLEPTVSEFELVAGFPPKAIADLDQTVQEAGLEDSKIIQRLK